MKRFIFASDLHGDQVDQRSVKALQGATKDFKPHYRIFGGDLMDARPLRKGASREEKAEGMQADWRAGIRFLKDQWVPTHVLMGNHDKRIYDLAEADYGIESEYAFKGVQYLEKALTDIRCEWLPYGKKNVFKIGGITFLHGLYHGANACRQHVNVYGSCIFGHIHAVDQYAAPSIKRRVAMSAGCLCNLDMKWTQNKPATLRHNHGFIMGIINEKNDAWAAWQVEEVDGKWHIPGKIKTI